MTLDEAFEVSAKSCLISLIFGSVWVSLVLAVGSALLLDEGLNVLTVLLAPLFALAVGLLPVLFFGVPAYAALLYKGWANYLTVPVLGAIPAVLLLPFWEGALSLLFIIYGPPVAAFAHFLSRRRVRSNKSSKPTPLRGAA